MEPRDLRWRRNGNEAHAAPHHPLPKPMQQATNKTQYRLFLDDLTVIIFL
jgi:hypothetical protein